jgi:hypothetical protein
MNFKERINAVLHLSDPDQVPFAPYIESFPSGEYERLLRNRGMGLVVRKPTVWAATPRVPVEERIEGELSVFIYHTPKGDLRAAYKQHSGRLYIEEAGICVEGLLKGLPDYEPLIYMIEDTEFRVDNSLFTDTVRDLGADGLFTEYGCAETPYGYARYLFGESSGFDKWVFEQADHPREFARLLEAINAREERRMQLIAESPSEYIRLGDIDGSWGPEVVRRHDLPFIKKWVPYLQSRGKILCVHAHAINLAFFKDLVAEMGYNVVEAFTPPPVGNLSIKEARDAWGKDTIIWVNFPETIFYQGSQATRKYTQDLLESDPPGNRLVIGFTEMGLWGASDPHTEQLFKEGILAIADVLDETGKFPIRPVTVLTEKGPTQTEK